MGNNYTIAGPVSGRSHSCSIVRRRWSEENLTAIPHRARMAERFNVNRKQSRTSFINSKHERIKREFARTSAFTRCRFAVPHTKGRRSGGERLFRPGLRAPATKANTPLHRLTHGFSRWIEPRNQSEQNETDGRTGQADSSRPRMKVYAIAIPRWASCRALPSFFAYWVLTDLEWPRHTRETLVAVSAVKVWLRDFSVLAGGIQAKVSALHRAHQLLDGATMPPRHQSGGLRGDARGRAERRTHH